MPQAPRRVFRLAVSGFVLGMVFFGVRATAADQDLPKNYWTLPLASQGKAPTHWTDIERSLAPEDCGSCHADQYAEWRTSLHARAFSPGLIGQLLAMNRTEADGCMNCHAPLAEQKEAFAAARQRGAGHRLPAVGLAAAGNSCAGCHRRGHRTYGPPQRATGATGPGRADAPHGGVVRTAGFERSEFCAACHQFPADQAVNGKPLENTVAEWRDSPQARRGETCQTCHMPERKHLWRGIHDPAMVASGLTWKTEATPEGARVELTNSGVGHAFPTYVTPKAVIRAVPLDAAGRPIENGAVERIIQRRVVFEGGEWVEKHDTRLMPEQKTILLAPWAGGDRIRAWLEIHPDDFYDHDVYDGLLADLPKGGPESALIAEADRQAAASRFDLFDTVVERER